MWRFATALLCAAALGAPATAPAQHARSGGGWPEYGGDLAGTRYSSEKQIQPSNVAGLQVAWTFHTHALDKESPGSNWRASFEATPVLWNGLLYFDTPFNQIFAVDAATGALRWTFDPQINREAKIYIVTSRGVALWHASKPRHGPCGKDRVVMATLDRRLMARDAATGVACPQFGAQGSVDLSKGVVIQNKDLYGFTSPPTVVGDTIVLGSSVGDNQTTFAASGAVRGFDAITGQQKWSYEPLAWTENQHPRQTGSGNVWSAMSADAEHDMVYLPTGSASVDYFGGTRIGDNRDADSIVALQASTGRRVWAFQFVHHDLWDYDTPSEPVLFTFRNSIPAVAVVTKTSMVFVFNRLTGEPLYPIVEKPVAKSTLEGEQSWPTQPFSSLPPLGPLSFAASDIHLHNADDEKFCRNLVSKLENDGLFTPPSKVGSVVYPGALGGANWGAAALDPSTGVLYTRISSMPFIVRQVIAVRGISIWATLDRNVRKALPLWAGGIPQHLGSQFKTPDSGGEQRDESPQMGTPYVLARQALMTPDETPCGPKPFGSIVALNLNTGQKLWTVPHGVMAKGEPGSIGDAGVIATAGGLLFAASTNDPFLRGYDAATGRELWKGALPVPSNATPMTYAVNGRQFVVMAAGGHGFIGKGQSDEVIAFALPAKAAPARRKTLAKRGR